MEKYLLVNNYIGSHLEIYVYIYEENMTRGKCKMRIINIQETNIKNTQFVYIRIIIIIKIIKIL